MTTSSEPLVSPLVSVSMSIKPPIFTTGSNVQITITATSHASKPITIFTWHTIFNLRLAQQRKNFTCIDLNTNTELFLELTKGPKRPGFNTTLGGRDDKYFQTLMPEEPKKFTERFFLAYNPDLEAVFEGGRQVGVVVGHRYKFAVREGEQLKSWWVGTKEEVMGPLGKLGHSREKDGESIVLHVEPVEFEVAESGE